MAWFNPRTKQAELILNAEREAKTPSLVYFGETENLVGKRVEELLDSDKDNLKRDDIVSRTVWSIKRKLSSPLRIALPGGRQVTPTQVAAEILRKLKHDAEKLHFREEVTRAVIACPAAFDLKERSRIREAAGLAGFTEVELIEEPVAAALAYAQAGKKVGEAIMVYDLGGGTFDLGFVVKDEDGTYRVALEADGDLECGGDYFDHALYAYWEKQAKRQLGENNALFRDGFNTQFLRQCKARKESLSLRSHVTYNAQLPGGERLELTIDRCGFEALIREQVENTIRKTMDMVKRAQANGYKADTVLLIGGSTEIPLVQRLLEECFPVSPLQWQYRDIAVALGAASRDYYFPPPGMGAQLPESAASPHTTRPSVYSPNADYSPKADSRAVDERAPTRADGERPSEEIDSGKREQTKLDVVDGSSLIEEMVEGIHKPLKPPGAGPQSPASMPRIHTEVMRDPINIAGQGWGSELPAILKDLDRINRMHGDLLVSLETFEELNKQMQEFRLTVPLLGHFSCGKSSLLNAWLGRPHLLKEDLSATTAMPIEISYSTQEQAGLTYENGTGQTISIEDFLDLQERRGLSRCLKVSLGLRAEILKSLGPMTIVDMPGFDSGYTAHDEAIDNYADSSIAYLAVFDADDTVRESVLRCLDELSLYEASFHVVMTKCDLKPPGELAAIESSVRDILEYRMGRNDFRIVQTSAFNDDISKLDGLLSDLAASGPQLYMRRFAPLTKALVRRASKILRDYLMLISMTESDLTNRRREIRQLNDQLRLAEDMSIRKLVSSLKSARMKVLEQVQSDFSNLIPIWATCLSERELFDEVKKSLRYHLAEAKRKFFDPILREFSVEPDNAETITAALHLDIFEPKLRDYFIQSMRSINGRLEDMFRRHGDGRAGSGRLQPIIDFLESPNRKEREELLRNRVVPELILHCDETLNQMIEGRIAVVSNHLRDAVKARINSPEIALRDLENEGNQRREQWGKAVEKAEEDLRHLQSLEQRLDAFAQQGAGVEQGGTPEQ
jgi:actin-like ATPase involved in cell morphogenesis/GTPase SAR1 family protein